MTASPDEKANAAQRAANIIYAARYHCDMKVMKTEIPGITTEDILAAFDSAFVSLCNASQSHFQPVVDAGDVERVVARLKTLELDPTYSGAELQDSLSDADILLIAKTAIAALRIPAKPDAGRMKGVWPDIIAPAQHENPAEGWQDPALPDFRKIWAAARELGYAVGIHGSLKRDVDLIAAPWTEDAADANSLVQHLCQALNATIIGSGACKPQGRFAICMGIDGWVKHIDLSVMPLSSAALRTPAAPDAKTWTCPDCCVQPCNCKMFPNGSNSTGLENATPDTVNSTQEEFMVAAKKVFSCGYEMGWTDSHNSYGYAQKRVEERFKEFETSLAQGGV